MQLLHFPKRQHRGEDVLSAHLELSRGAPFCADPDCALHVRLVDDRVAGGGNWVVLPDGRIFGRGRYGAALLCDACGTRRGPVRLAVVALSNWGAGALDPAPLSGAIRGSFAAIRLHGPPALEL